ncbi:hypothetical protein CYMTET_4499, partial [Cymbomonas tetramitiformis]
PMVQLAELVYDDQYEEGVGPRAAAAPVDEDPPVITRLGPERLDLLQRHAFTDPGASAQDDVDGPGVPVVVRGADEVDACCLTDPEAPFVITYEATDRAGNRAASVSRQVAVVPACEPPSFLCEELVGVVCAVCDTSGTGQPQPEPTCICLDNDLDATEEAVVQPYEPPRDTTPPVLTLYGNGVLGVTASGTVIMVHELSLAQTFIDPGIHAHDDIDGNLTAAISSFGVGAIDTSLVTPPDAPYVVRYSVADAAGNTAAEVRRRVSVVDPCASQGERVCGYVESAAECSTAGLCLSSSAASGESEPASPPPRPPVLELIGPSAVEVAEGAGAYAACPEQYDRSLVCDRGAAAHDALDGDLSARVLACSLDGVTQRFSSQGVTGCAIDTNTPGVYTVEFFVENSAGRSARAYRNVTVAAACPVGEALCPNGVQCSFSGVCMDGLDSPKPEAPVDHPPTVTLATTPQVATAFVDVKQHALYVACGGGNEAGGVQALCEPGATAADEEDGDLSASVLSCPPDSCREIGCPGHEWAAKGIEGCLNTSAEVGAMFQVEFLVYDSAVPSQTASLYRTITIIAPCEPDEVLCEDLSCSSVDCDLRDSLLTEPPGDVAPPVITFRGPSKVVVGYGDAAGAAGLAPCPAETTTGCYVVAEDAGAAGDATLDVSSALEVRQDLGCSACGDHSSCMFALLDQCFPGSYAYLFAATDAAGNRGVARLWVSVEEHAAITGVIQVAANTANVTEAYALADTLTQRGSVANTAVRQGLISAANLGRSPGQALELAGSAITGVAVRGADDRPVARGSEVSATASGLGLAVSFALNVTSSSSSGGDGAAQRRRRLRKVDGDANPPGSSSVDGIAAAITTSASNGMLSTYISTAAAASGDLEGSHSAAVEVTEANDMTAADLTPKVDATAAYAAKIRSEMDNMQRRGDAMAEELSLALAETAESTASSASPEPVEGVLELWLELQEADFDNVEELGHSADEMLARFLKLQAAFELVQKGVADAQLTLQQSYGAVEKQLEQSEQWSAPAGPLTQSYDEDLASARAASSCHYPAGRNDAVGAGVRVYSFLADSSTASARRRLLGRRGGGESGDGASALITGGDAPKERQAAVAVKYPRYGSWKMPLKTAPAMLRGPRETDRGRHLPGGRKNSLVSGIFFYIQRGRDGQTCHSRFAHLEAPCVRGRWEGRYGSDPVFRPGSPLFRSALQGQEGVYYNTSEALNAAGVPMPFAPRAALGLSGGQPFLIDTRMDAYHAWETYAFLAEGYAMDKWTKAVDVRMMTWNSQQQVWTSTRLRWYRTIGGWWEVEMDIQLAPVQYWDRGDTANVLILLVHIAWAAVSLLILLQTARTLMPSQLSKEVVAESYGAMLMAHFASPGRALAAVGAISQVMVVIHFLSYQAVMLGDFSPSATFDVAYDLNSDANHFMSDRAPADVETPGGENAGGPAAGAAESPAWARPVDNGGLEAYLQQEGMVGALALVSRYFFLAQAARSCVMMVRMLLMVGQQSRLGVLTKTVRGSLLELLQTGVFVLVILMWAQLMNLEAGLRTESYSTISRSIDTLTRLGILGDWVKLKDESWESLYHETLKAKLYQMAFAFLYQLVYMNFILAILCDELMKHLSASRTSPTMVQDLKRFHRNRMNVKIWKKWPSMDLIVDALTRKLHGASGWEILRKRVAPKISISQILANGALFNRSKKDPSIQVAGVELTNRLLGVILHQEYKRFKRKPRDLQRAAIAQKDQAKVMVRASLGLPPKSPSAIRVAYEQREKEELSGRAIGASLLNSAMARNQFACAADSIVNSDLCDKPDKTEKKLSRVGGEAVRPMRGAVCRTELSASLHYMAGQHWEGMHSLKEATHRVEALLFAYACKLEARAAQSRPPSSAQMSTSARPSTDTTLVHNNYPLSITSQSQSTNSPPLGDNSTPRTPSALQP